MKFLKRTTSIILILIILFYGIMNIFLNNEVKARERTNDISNLGNYQEIYNAIQELKVSHPNWTFTILYTGLDWNSVIYNETQALHTRSLVNSSLVNGNVSDWVCPVCGTTPKDSGSWYCASAKTVSYYMDPRNWLNETYIFAFETLSFNSSVHTVEGVKSILKGTFMDKNTITYTDTAGNTQTINKSYAQVIYEAGQKNNVSPYHLAARIRQEQGTGGTSLTSGTYSGFVGYYNFFNIGASGNSSAEIIRNGLTRAKNSGWTTPELAIIGGAEFLKGGYIGNCQDTLYLQKYNVDSNNVYSVYGHQYQQNVSAPYTEGAEVYDAYESLGILNSDFNFIIPVYENMPSVASVKPGRNIQFVTEDVIVQTSSVDLNIRSGPSTGYYVKAKAAKGTRLIRIEKAQDISSDGRYWDRIAYNTGTQVIIGYVSREYLGDTATIENVSEAVTIGTVCNLRNGPSTTNTYVKQVLQPSTNITIIDKMLYPIDGHIWYRVKLEDGTQGFISSAFLQTEPVVVEKYRIEGLNILVSPDTKIEEIPDAVLVSSVFGTGGKLSINGHEYIIYMIGDSDGDGIVDSADLLKIVKHLKGIATLSETRSADANNDGTVDSADLLKIVKHLKGLSSITI